jgi:uncharacterized protein (DUF2236 family)
MGHDRGVEALRATLADAIRARVAGDGASDHARELFRAAGERWYRRGDPVWVVHADVALFVGGLRALLLQTMHPLAMAGVADHSDFRDDPWGRLQRTARFLATTTYGTAEQARAACATVRAVHSRVTGVAADGRPYHANDPHLLEWVHIAEADSFLAAHQRYGARRLDATGCDGYVAGLGRVASELGVVDPPRTVAELRRRIDAFRPELRGTAEARDAAQYLLLQPPLPLAARPAYTVLAAAATSLLPWWAKLGLRLPWLPMTETIAVRPAGQVLVHLLRWALTPGSPTRAMELR